MSECVECGQTMRPRNTTAAQYPGTVSYNGTRCGGCNNRAYREARGLAPKQHTTAACTRCGIERVIGGNSSAICRDCRSVLTAQEREVWAA